MQALEAAVVDTAQAWAQDGSAPGAVREGIGGVDETFVPRMMRVLQDVATGSLLWEDVAAARTFATWHAVVAARLKALGTAVFSVVSDRAQALIQRAEQGLECRSMPEVFPGVHDIVKSYALAMGQRVRHAPQELMTAKAALACLQELSQAEYATRAAKALGEVRQAEVRRWQAVHPTSRRHGATLSLTLHPYRSVDATPQTSAQVESQRTVAVEAIGALAQGAPLPARHAARTKVRTQ
jgi:hypothetical protein